MNSSLEVDWFKHNGLMASPNKFQLMVLGDRDGIEITRCDDIDLPGVNIDPKFNFDKHVTNLCSRVNMQLKVIKRSRKLIRGQTRLLRFSQTCEL